MKRTPAEVKPEPKKVHKVWVSDTMLPSLSIIERCVVCPSNSRSNSSSFSILSFFSVEIESVFIVILTIVLSKLLASWRDDIISGKKVLTEVVVVKLSIAGQSFIDSLYYTNFFASVSLTKNDIDFLNERLTKITKHELLHATGTEGGFYLKNLNEFLGYAFPTSPPPIPAFGPPPRSFNIIKEQVITSITQDSFIVNLHSFDPAIFPLASKPLETNSEIIAAVWARIHVERDLPQLEINQILQIAGIISFLGFMIALFTSLRSRKNMEDIKTGLQKLEQDSSFRYGKMPGVYDFIGISINKLVSRMTEFYNQKQSLEKELYQQDK